jgi:hypothetical protein
VIQPSSCHGLGPATTHPVPSFPGAFTRHRAVEPRVKVGNSHQSWPGRAEQRGYRMACVLSCALFAPGPWGHTPPRDFPGPAPSPSTPEQEDFRMSPQGKFGVEMDRSSEPAHSSRVLDKNRQNDPFPRARKCAIFGVRFSSLTHHPAPTRQNTAFPRSRPQLPRRAYAGAYAYPAPCSDLPPPALCPASRQRTTAWRRPGKEERERNPSEMLVVGWATAGRQPCVAVAGG